MSFIEMVDSAEAEGLLKTLYEEAMAANGGQLPLISQVAGLYPEGLQIVAEQDAAICQGGSTLGRRREEMLATMAASGYGCAYLCARHGELLREVTGDDRLVYQLQSDHTQAELDGAERAMLDFAARLNVSPGEMVADELAPLREAGFGEREILDIVMVVAQVNFMIRIAGGLGLQPDEAWLESRHKAEAAIGGGRH